MIDGRREARAEILQAANRYRLQRARYVRTLVWRRETPAPKLLSSRHIQQAVTVVRHHQLIADDVLVPAGYQPTRNSGSTAGLAEAA